jgi:hypothetical protein
MNRVELKKELKRLGVPEEVIEVVPRILIACNKTFLEPDGARSDTFRGNDGIISSNAEIFRPNGINFVGVNNENLRDVFVQIKEPSHNENGKTIHDPIQVIIGLFTEDGKVIVTKALPRKLTLFSPEVSIYSSEKAMKYQMENLNQITDVFDIIFREKIKPDSVTKLKCERISYRAPFEATRMINLVHKTTKQKQMH